MVSYMLDEGSPQTELTRPLFSLPICLVFYPHASASIPTAVHLPKVAVHRATGLVHIIHIISSVSCISVYAGEYCA